MQVILYICEITLHMINYTSQYQTKIEEFGNLYQMKLNQKNRWIQLGFHLPWDKLVQIYEKHFSEKGSTAINPRIVIGSLIIKHKMNLSDEATVQIIEENPYMQFFLGLDEFSPFPLFAPTLFVDWRKKLEHETFNKFTDVLIKICFPESFETKNVTDSTSDSTSDSTPKNKGKLKLDATVADQYITYPNDLGLLNKAREITEKIVDDLYEKLRNQLPQKPRTYRKVARKKFLIESKKRQKNKKTLRSAIRYMLNCLDRNIGYIHKMLDLLVAQKQKQKQKHPLTFKQMRQLWIIQTLNEQQREMYQKKTNRCDDRIVSISQPHVRPIVRGKAGKKVEFGAKIGLALMDGFVKANTLKWDAYNESADLIPHAKAYKELYGYYPELIQVDQIYGTNKNRTWCKENNIRMTVIPKGKPKTMTAYEKKKKRKETNERNHIEGKIGQAKQGYRLNSIRAKLSQTSNTWIGITLFITNLVKFAQLNNFQF